MARKTRINHLTSPELIASINPQNVDLMKEYIDYLKSIQRSPTTIDVYRNDLEIVFCWNAENNGNRFFVDWTKRDVIKLQNWLINDNGNSPARVRRIKATLSSLSNFIENILDDEYKDFRNIIHRIESPAIEFVREKTVLSDEQVDTLLNTLVERKDYMRACLVALAICSGRRKAELVRFKVKHFDDTLICDGALYKTSERIKTKGRGVNGKQLYCYVLAKRFTPYLNMWLEDRERRGIDSEWLFPSLTDYSQHLRPSTLSSWANTFSSILGVDVYMHSFRHAWTTSLIRSGLPESVVRELQGWDSITMVETYSDIDAEERFAEYFKGGDVVAVEKKGLQDI